MQSSVVTTQRGLDLGFLEDNAMISVSKCMLGHRRLLRRPQTTVATVFTYSDAEYRSNDVYFSTRTRHTFPDLFGLLRVSEIIVSSCPA